MLLTHFFHSPDAYNGADYLPLFFDDLNKLMQELNPQTL